MKKKNLLIHLFLTAIALVLTITASKSSLFSQFELKSLDFRFLLRGKEKPEPALVIIGIDDASLARFGRWPWPRSYHGELLNTLSGSPPRTIGFDFLFGEVDVAHPEWDEAFIYYSQLLGSVVFGSYFELPEEESKKGTFLKKEEKAKVREASFLQSSALTQVTGKSSDLRHAVSVNLPFLALAQSGQVGFINAPRDSDGVIRRLPLILEYEQKVYPSFVLQLLMNYWKVDQSAVRVEMGNGVHVATREGEIFIPLDPHGNLLVNFIGDHSDFNEALFVQVLNAPSQIEKGEKPDVDLEKFWKKIVLVALTATGTTDMGAFPLSGHSPLIAIHANALNTILRGNYLYETKPMLQWGIITAMGILVFIICTFLSPLKSALTSAFLLVGFSVGNYLFFLAGWWLPFILPVLIWILITLIITTFRYFAEEKEKRYVRKAFGQYVSGNILKELLEDPSKLKLGGERKELTVLFSDIRGFTTFCENRNPEDVVEMLNEYLDRMTEVIFKHNGTIDKYVGDAIVAFFGAPSTHPEQDHALRACRAALGMIEELKSLHTKWKAEGKEPLGIGIGLNSGPMLVGNMGSHRKFDYTVIGDNVNLGARLEGLTRQFDCDIILSEYTYQHVRNLVSVRRLDEVTVKGKNRSVIVYELQQIQPS